MGYHKKYGFSFWRLQSKKVAKSVICDLLNMQITGTVARFNLDGGSATGARFNLDGGSHTGALFNLDGGPGTGARFSLDGGSGTVALFNLDGGSGTGALFNLDRGSGAVIRMPLCAAVWTHEGRIYKGSVMKEAPRVPSAFPDTFRTPE